MATQPVPNAKFRAFDSNGDPLSGGKLYTYAAGTSTPLATYTTRAGSVANANPVVLNANGEADVWLTSGVLYKFELRNSSEVVQWTVDNIPSPEDSSDTGDITTEPGGRVTLTTATPVTTSDVSGATTVYYSPYKHNKVPLYDGTAWASYDVGAELSQTTADNTKSPAAVANNSNYDMFVWSDNGTLRCTRGPAWTSDTARGTGAGTSELERVSGRLVNKQAISNGPAAQRGLYVGTIRSDGSAQINDTVAKRHVWNLYNQVDRPMHVVDSANNWNYNTASYRQANGNAANQIDFVVGIASHAVHGHVNAHAAPFHSSGTDMVAATVGVGFDSTTAIGAGALAAHVSLLVSSAGPVSSPVASLHASITIIPDIGRHFLAWLEKGAGAIANVTQAWYGDNGSADVRSGISGVTKG